MDNLICVPPSLVPRILPLAGPLLSQATVRTRLGSYECIERRLNEGRSLLWLALDDDKIVACAATELTECDGAGLVCTITACAGKEARQWVSLIGQIEHHATLEGCSAVRFFGRRGWLRLLQDYDAIGIVAEKRLDTGTGYGRSPPYRGENRTVTT